MTHPTLSMAEVNSMERAAFVAAFGAVYERSPWVAEGAWAMRPFADPAALERSFQTIVLNAGDARQLELLRMHPRLGTRKPLSGYSQAEQAGAGLLAAAEREREQLAVLNQAYEQKFGFPFIIAVRNASLQTILASCEGRMNNDVQTEFDESLRQVFTIARFRLSDLLGEGTTASR